MDTLKGIECVFDDLGSAAINQDHETVGLGPEVDAVPAHALVRRSDEVFVGDAVGIWRLT